MEKEHESLDIENFSEFDEKSLSPSIPKHSVSETPVEQTSSNREDHVSGQILADEAGVNITKCNCSTKIKTMNLSGLFQSLQECIEIIKNDIWKNERSYSMESSPNTEFSFKKIENLLNVLSSIFKLREEILLSKIENKDLFKRMSLLDKRLNIFENKIYRKIKSVIATVTSVEQASSRTDYIRTRQILGDNDARINVTGCNYPSKIETMNLPGPSTESELLIDIADIEKYILAEAKPEKIDIVQKEEPEEESKLDITILSGSSTPKFARNPQKFQFVHEFLQKIKDDNKSKNRSNEKSYSMESSFEEFSFTEPLNASPNTLNHIRKLRFEEITHLSEKRKSFRESIEQPHGIKQIHRENNLDGMSETSVEQASPSRTDYVRDDALAENDAYINVTGTNLLITETNLSGLPIEEPSSVELDASEIAQPIISKSTLALKSQSLQECAQEIESDKKLENLEDIESFSTESFSFTESLNTLKNIISICKTTTPEMAPEDLNDIICFYVEILRKLNSNDRIKNSEKVLNRNRQLLAELQEYLEIKKKNDCEAETFDIKESDSTTETSVEPDQVGQIPLRNMSATEPSLIESDATEITRASKSALKLKSQSSQECVPNIKNDNKSENYEEFIESSSANSSLTEESETEWNIITDYFREIINPHIEKVLELIKIYNNLIYDCVQKLREINSDSTIESENVLNRNSQLFVEIQYYLRMNEMYYFKSGLYGTEQISQEVESNSTTETFVEQDEVEQILLQNTFTRKPSPKSDATEVTQPSTSKSAIEIKNHSLQECIQKIENDTKSKNYEKSTEFSSAKSSFTESLNTPRNTISNNTETSYNQKVSELIEINNSIDDQPETINDENFSITQDLEAIRFAEYRLMNLLILLIVFVCTSLFYFSFQPVRMNDEHADTFATAVIEVEEGILDHDATVRVLTEYLERDTRLLKVIALIGDTSVDKPYTVDIIKKRLRKRRNNSFSLSLPSFVVLENLRAEHSTVVIDYVETYQEAYGNQELTIVAVFKVEQIDDDLTRADINHVINTVKEIFIKANIIMKIIPFKPLSEEALEKYIINTAENIGQTLSQDQIDYNKRRLIEDFTNCQKECDCYKDHI